MSNSPGEEQQATPRRRASPQKAQPECAGTSITEVESTHISTCPELTEEQGQMLADALAVFVQQVADAYPEYRAELKRRSAERRREREERERLDGQTQGEE